jgi:N-acetylglutamate synthase
VNRASRDQRPAGQAAVRYRLEVRLSAADTGSRVVIRWRRPAGNGDEVADVLGVLAAADAASFTVRKATGELVIIPRDRALAGRTVPAAPRRGQGTGTSPR